LGLIDGAGDLDDIDPTNRLSARVQCVVARAAPIDLVGGMSQTGGTDALAAYLGASLARATPGSPEYRVYQQASPLLHVSPSAPPFLLLHGDADEVVPVRNSELLNEALQRVGVPSRLIKIEGGGHGPGFPGAVNPPDYLEEMVAWFDRHLRDKSTSVVRSTELETSGTGVAR
jgi:dipeptidyl aminopeptidase/acylaminoacyl peptidase